MTRNTGNYARGIAAREGSARTGRPSSMRSSREIQGATAVLGVIDHIFSFQVSLALTRSDFPDFARVAARVTAPCTAAPPRDDEIQPRALGIARLRQHV